MFSRIFSLTSRLDLADLVFGERFVVAEVKAQAVGVDERSCLADVVAEHLLQRPVQKVGGGVVVGDLLAPLGIDVGGDGLPTFESPFVEFADDGRSRRNRGLVQSER